METSEIVMVPVPSHLLGEVYQLLSQRMIIQDTRTGQTPTSGVQSPTTAEPAAPSGARQTRSSVEWAAADLGRLLSRIDELGLVGARSLLDLASRAPGQRVTFSQAQRASGIEWSAARHHLARLSSVIHNEFTRENWPVRVRSAADGKRLYSFDNETMAAEWRSLRGLEEAPVS